MFKQPYGPTLVRAYIYIYMWWWWWWLDHPSPRWAFRGRNKPRLSATRALPSTVCVHSFTQATVRRVDSTGTGVVCIQVGSLVGLLGSMPKAHAYVQHA